MAARCRRAARRFASRKGAVINIVLGSTSQATAIRCRDVDAMAMNWPRPCPTAGKRRRHVACRSCAGDQPQTKQGHTMGLGTLLLILLVLLLIGVLPTWPHSSSWGYGPSGGLGVILVIVLILVLMGRI